MLSLVKKTPIIKERKKEDSVNIIDKIELSNRHIEIIFIFIKLN